MFSVNIMKSIQLFDLIMENRTPIVAGQFYPNSKIELTKLIEGFVLTNPKQFAAQGIILPHAAYIYSGKVAALTIQQCQKRPKIIILGPNHNNQGDADFAIWAKGKWETPLGEIDINNNLAKKTLENCQLIKDCPYCHLYEHSIEVQLPLLKYFFKDFSFLPISCKVVDFEKYLKLAEELYQTIKQEKEEILLIASSDMNHYETEHITRRKDRLAIKQILELNSQGLYETILKEEISICGFGPIIILLELCKKMKKTKAELISYQTSADINHDPSSCVGYAGITIH